jgi:2-oxoglutarate dehydrogenase E1 component
VTDEEYGRWVMMSALNRAFLENLYEQFQNDPSSLPAEWRQYFSEYEKNGQADPIGSPSFPALRGQAQNAPLNPDAMNVADLQDRVDQLVRGFRVRGHLEAQIDPLGIPRPTNRELNVASYALLPGDMKKKFSAGTITGDNFRTLEEIVEQLRTTYCRSIGAQFMHIDDHGVREWLQNQMESSQNRLQLNREVQLRILTKLTDAVILEEFMRRKFMGAKTFSLEGGETLIPLLDLSINNAYQHGVKEVVMGMAHRGRLNVLANILGKRSKNIFWSYDDPDPEASIGAGDVLYHLGYSNEFKTSDGGSIHISLCFNPSHLEFVNPVALGRCRSKQDRISDTERSQVMTILIHGDAAFAGEGVVQETLNMSQLPGYQTGGTLHIVLNNQIGFTTSANLGRSTTYATDVAKMLQIPIFHVNGEDPEAVAQVVELSMEFRRKFQRDVVIDMYCYRRFGHNESDEPRYTQPLMYKAIDKRPTVRDSYMERLLELNEISQEEADLIAANRKQQLQREFEEAKSSPYQSDLQALGGYWEGYYGGPERDDDDIETGVATGKLSFLIKRLTEFPKEFKLHRRLKPIFEHRREMADGKRDIDWAMAELAAMASLAVEGHPVRLSGQDSERGTFSQRHAVLYDSEKGSAYAPIMNLTDDQARVEIINSPLAETGVLGFDYGYSLDHPEALVMWEAQFGDFWNAAQVIVDQFITSAEDKWRRLSGMTMLLPHGFEGAGPEHSSARLERFLTLSAEHNIQVVYPTTAAQYFHVLRRQVIRKWRKPLIVLTPKGLLREPFVATNIDEMAVGKFQRVIGDPLFDKNRQPEKIVLCSGKIAVDLLKEREEAGRDDVAIIRLEQLYPLPHAQLQQALEPFREGIPAYWVQEEPHNMGAWYFIKVNFGDELYGKWPLEKISRPESASPSTGSKKAHKIEHERLIREVLQPIGQPIG